MRHQLKDWKNRALQTIHRELSTKTVDNLMRLTFMSGVWMVPAMLCDEQSECIEPLLRGKASDPGCIDRDNRCFIKAVFWIMRTGSPWCDLPTELGDCHRVYVRFSRWLEEGVWERLAQSMRGDVELEYLFIDSTVVRAYQHSSSLQTKQAASTSVDCAAD